MLFLDAEDDTLVRRFSETRRRHPYGAEGRGLEEAIAAERAALAELRDRASVVWDTSRLTLGMLKERIGATFAGTGARRLAVAVVAFGFKYGLPLDADLVFDVRFLPNPNYVEGLRELTGADAPVAAYLEALPDTEAFLQRLFPLIDFLVPRYEQRGQVAGHDRDRLHRRPPPQRLPGPAAAAPSAPQTTGVVATFDARDVSR